MSITRLPEIVFPLAQVNKVNEIVDVLNDNLNMYYSTTIPALTPVDGVCTWTVTHNLGTENVNCSLYNGDNLVISNVSITSENEVTVKGPLGVLTQKVDPCISFSIDNGVVSLTRQSEAKEHK